MSIRIYFDTDEDVWHFRGEDLILVCLNSEDEESIFLQTIQQMTDTLSCQ